MIIDLATVYRNKQIESIHYGIAVLVKGEKTIQSWGNADFKCFTRSIIKPIQAKVSLSFISENIPDKYIFSEKTVVFVMNCVKEDCSRLELTKEDSKNINDIHSLSRGTFLYDLYKNSLNNN